MYKSLRILVIFTLLFSFIFIINSNISYATEDLNTVPTSEESNVATDDLPTEDYLSTTEPGINSIQRISSIPEANLGLNNILNIILIAIGILLILLAIAILIRLKQ